MSKSRTAGVTVVASLAVLLLGAGGTASAQTAQPTKALTQVVDVTGTKGFKGTFAIDRFARRGGQTVAVGTLKGRLRGRRVTERNVAMPIELSRAAQGAQVLPPTPGACSILDLLLRPITLDLLGLRVRTSLIHVRIEGVPGPGNLLGNLLCGITGILDPATVPAGQQVALLNAILAIVPRS